MILGELEKRVLQYLWKVPNADAKQVHQALTKRQGGKLNTVQSALDRLFKKDLLSREKQGHAFYYQAKIEREELIAKLIQSVASDFVTDGEDGMIAAFSSFSAGLDDEKLSQLEKLIQQQRQLRGQDKPDADQ